MILIDKISCNNCLCFLPFEYRVCSSEDTINDVKISTRKMIHHFFHKTWPFIREVFTTNDTDGITQLEWTEKNLLVRNIR